MWRLCPGELSPSRRKESPLKDPESEDNRVSMSFGNKEVITSCLGNSSIKGVVGTEARKDASKGSVLIIKKLTLISAYDVLNTLLTYRV